MRNHWQMNIMTYDDGNGIRAIKDKSRYLNQLIIQNFFWVLDLFRSSRFDCTVCWLEQCSYSIKPNPLSCPEYACVMQVVTKTVDRAYWLIYTRICFLKQFLNDCIDYYQCIQRSVALLLSTIISSLHSAHSIHCSVQAERLLGNQANNPFDKFHYLCP